MSTPDLTTDRLLDALASDYRRVVLAVLDAEATEVSLSTLAAEYVARTSDVESPAHREAEQRRTRVLLHHQHLPKLDAAGFLAYDSEARTVAPNARALERLEQFESSAGEPLAAVLTRH